MNDASATLLTKKLEASLTKAHNGVSIRIGSDITVEIRECAVGRNKTITVNVNVPQDVPVQVSEA